jgi:hypothetical protein
VGKTSKGEVMTPLELYESIKSALSAYDNNRYAAAEILDVDGMEEAIIDELRDRGYMVREDG